jgi:hypothetical protein
VPDCLHGGRPFLGETFRMPHVAVPGREHERVGRRLAKAKGEALLFHAIPAVSGLIQRDAAGTFLFLDAPDECRLSFVYRDAGARQVDYDAVHAYFDRAA